MLIDRTTQSPTKAARAEDLEMVLCIAEDRKSCEPGLRVLLASLNVFCRGVDVWLYIRNSSMWLNSWVEEFTNISIRQYPFDAEGWNVKPAMLLEALDAGYKEVVWIDSDIVITSDFRISLRNIPTSKLVVTENARWGKHSDGDAERTRAWGYSVGRTLPFSINTCLTRVSAPHREILVTWREITHSERFLEAQRMPIMERPTHMTGCQDAFQALLCSAEFKDIDLEILLIGVGITQAFGLKGFTTKERILAIFRGMPPMIHAQQFKPWLIKRKRCFGEWTDGVVEFHLQ